MDDSLDYCRGQVRTYDYDRYLCSLFLPAEARRAAWVLFAWNHEIASIGEIASEETIGHIRLAWWREALDEIYAGKTVRRHIVAQALAEVIVRHRFSRVHFDTVLAARARDLQLREFETREELSAYARTTSAPLLQLLAEAMGAAAPPFLDDIGEAWAITGLLRAAPLLMDNGESPIPQEIMQRHESLYGAALELALYARSLLKHWDDNLVPDALKPLQVFADCCDIRLAQVRRRKWRLWRPSPGPGKFWIIVQLIIKNIYNIRYYMY